MRSAEPIQTSGSPALSNSKSRECSRKRPRTLRTRMVSTPQGAGRSPPSTSWTLAPASRKARASSTPMAPVLRLVRRRTGSRSSRVGPEVMTTRRPARPRSFGAASIWMASAMTATSASLPAPSSPQARSPEPGSTTAWPKDLKRVRFACTAGCSHMPVFMAGAHSTGARVASSTVLSRSEARPLAVFPRLFAVAGTTATRSAQRASSICSTVGFARHSNWSGLAP